MPPLRDRAADIGLLSGHFLEIYAKKYQKIGLSLSKEVIQALESYEWPGNVRELQHSLERAVIMSEENTIKVGDLNLAKVNDLNAPGFEDYNLEDLEAWAIKKALMKHNGNVSHAAKELGLSRGAMYRRMEKYGL
ncbi:MAG: sigma-54-dependent Fis family transcriptional regulator, partial [Cytophagales bacterium]|nr:sigma-54-dependent Fis family transcriptional regulator [Cytophagales bacterium]